MVRAGMVAVNDAGPVVQALAHRTLCLPDVGVCRSMDTDAMKAIVRERCGGPEVTGTCRTDKMAAVQAWDFIGKVAVSIRASAPASRRVRARWAAPRESWWVRQVGSRP